MLYIQVILGPNFFKILKHIFIYIIFIKIIFVIQNLAHQPNCHVRKVILIHYLKYLLKEFESEMFLREFRFLPNRSFIDYAIN